MIHQLIYSSKSTAIGAGLLGQLRDIMSVSQRRNGQDGITGFLIFDKVWFVQILEGDRHAVSKTYARIADDKRHSALSVVGVKDVQHRDFPDWSMGSALRTPEVQGVYLRHGIGGPLEPNCLSGPQIIALARDLNAYHESQRLRRAS